MHFRKCHNIALILKFTRKKQFFLPWIQPWTSATNHPCFPSICERLVWCQSERPRAAAKWQDLFKNLSTRAHCDGMPGFNYMTHGFNQEGVLIPASCERVIGFKCRVDSLRVGWGMIGLGDNLEGLRFDLEFKVLRRVSRLGCPHFRPQDVNL